MPKKPTNEERLEALAQFELPPDLQTKLQGVRDAITALKGEAKVWKVEKEFSPDGRFLGDLGELIAKIFFGVTLNIKQEKGHDTKEAEVDGDTAQHRAVERGDALRILENHASLPAVELKEIWRQKADAHKAIVADLQGGNLEGAFKRLDKLGMLREMDADKRHEALATDWGLNDFGQTNVPANATNVIAIAAGGQQSLALLKNGTVMQWGQTNGAIPAGLSNVTAIAAGTNFCLALLSNATVVAWGDNTFGETNVPANVTNAVAVAAGGSHAMALLQNGTIVSWGDNTYGQTNVPGNLTNAMAIAAGDENSMALLNTGSIVVWGDNTFGETNVVGGLNNMKLIAAGKQFLLAVQFSPTVMYPVSVSQDLLLIYNTNSVGSTIVENYYLHNRPLVSGANVLGIGCLTNETILGADFTNQILLPYLSWLNQNPTKRPQYLVLFMDIPSIVQSSASSVQYQLYTATANGNPFVTSINMNGNGGTNDCIAYINKLATIGVLVSSNSPLLSASANGYGNTNYILDNVNNLGYSESIVSNAITGLVDAGVQTNSIFYLYGYENGFTLPHLTNAVNVAG